MDLKTALEQHDAKRRASSEPLPQELTILRNRLLAVRQRLHEMGRQKNPTAVGKGIAGTEAIAGLMLNNKPSEFVRDNVQLLTERADAKLQHLASGGDPDDFRLRTFKKRSDTIGKAVTASEIAQSLVNKIMTDEMRQAVFLDYALTPEQANKVTLLKALVSVYPDVKV